MLKVLLPPATPAAPVNYIKGAATVFIAGVVARSSARKKWTVVSGVFSSHVLTRHTGGDA